MAPPRGSRAVVGVLVGVVLATSSGCGLLDHTAEAPDGAARPRVVEGISTVLDERARAARAGDTAAFLATVDRDDAALVRHEGTYLANLAQLPVARLRYLLDPATLVPEGDGWSALVEVRLRLWGFDRWPVVSRERLGFTHGPDGSSYVLSERRRDESSGLQPWDRRPVVVRERPGILGIFDRDSAARADAVLDSVAAGIEQVGSVVPYPWERQVVVYALSGTSALSAIADLPGGDPDRLDGVSLPLGRRGDLAASTRLVLHPRMLEAPAAERDRLVRHELTHIAVAHRDDHVPTWLSEGIAEHVSVQPIDESDRLLARPALVAAAGPRLELPETATFNGPDSEANYGVSWWACEALVDLYGEGVLWRLLDAIDATGGEPWAEVLTEQLRLTPDDLAAEAARRVVAAYGSPR